MALLALLAFSIALVQCSIFPVVFNDVPLQTDIGLEFNESMNGYFAKGIS